VRHAAAERNPADPKLPASVVADSPPATQVRDIKPIAWEEDASATVPVSLFGIISSDDEAELPAIEIALPNIESPITATDYELETVEVGPSLTPAPIESEVEGGWGHTEISQIGLVPQAEVAVPAPAATEYFPAPACEGGCGFAGHTIRVGDELEIKFPHKPLFSEKVMVREDGMVAVPLIEPVHAAGLTPEALQTELQNRYRALQYDPSSVRSRPIDKKYLLSVKDKLDIRFDSENSNSALNKLSDTVTIRPDGKISLPLIGTLAAEGKTPEELEEEIVSRYREYYRDAKPVLIVREFTNNKVLIDGRMKRTGMKDIDNVVVLTRTFERMVYVGGEVQKPGFVKFRGPMTVSQAIIAAGGPKRTAELRTVARFQEGVNQRVIGDLIDLKTQWTYEKQKKTDHCKRPAVDDMLLGANDVVIVPKTRIAKLNDCLDQYLYQLIPMTRNTQFQYLYTTGTTVGAFGF
jgi:polysaccharide export outer membrane protein